MQGSCAAALSTIIPRPSDSRLIKWRPPPPRRVALRAVDCKQRGTSHKVSKGFKQIQQWDIWRRVHNNGSQGRGICQQAVEHQKGLLGGGWLRAGQSIKSRQRRLIKQQAHTAKISNIQCIQWKSPSQEYNFKVKLFQKFQKFEKNSISFCIINGAFNTQFQPLPPNFQRLQRLYNLLCPLLDVTPPIKTPARSSDHYEEYGRPQRKEEDARTYFPWTIPHLAPHWLLHSRHPGKIRCKYIPEDGTALIPTISIGIYLSGRTSHKISLLCRTLIVIFSLLAIKSVVEVNKLAYQPPGSHSTSSYQPSSSRISLECYSSPTQLCTHAEKLNIFKMLLGKMRVRVSTA